MATELTERRQLILKLVVQEFIDKAMPVASETLTRKYELSISPATVRNELSTLEEFGYLTHLHTSAGRIPTDSGYRFFVEHLMDHVSLPPEEQQAIRQQFQQVHGDLDQWIQLAAAVLARKAQVASVITPPRAYHSRIKHMELVAINDTLILMVLVLHGGTVKQQIITFEGSYNQHRLREISTHINDQCADATIDRLRDMLAQAQQNPSATFDSLEQYVIRLIIQSMQHFESEINEQIHSDGLLEMLSQPEFILTLMKEEDSQRAIERMRQMLEILTSSRVLGRLILQTLDNDDVQIIIGSEHTDEEMHEYSVVLSRYGVDGAAAGVLGVIGPTRMAYPRSISTVRYLSFVMSDLLSRLYGAETPTYTFQEQEERLTSRLSSVSTKNLFASQRKPSTSKCG